MAASRICPLFHADWQTSVSIAPRLAAHGSVCPSSLGSANLVATSVVVTKGKGPGSGPFETSAKSSHTANSVPEGPASISFPGRADSPACDSATNAAVTLDLFVWRKLRVGVLCVSVRVLKVFQFPKIAVPSRVLLAPLSDADRHLFNYNISSKEY